MRHNKIKWNIVNKVETMISIITSNNEQTVKEEKQWKLF